MPRQIEVMGPGATVLPLFSKDPVRSVTKAEQVQSLLNEDFVQLTVESAVKLDLTIGQTVSAYGRIYTMNQMPTVRRSGNRKFSYEVRFEGVHYDMRRASFLNEDSSAFNTTGDFSLTGDAEFYLDVVLNNLNRVFPGVWSKGDFPTTEARTMSFNEINTLGALQQICKEFETEFEVIGKTIHIRKVGQILGHTYEYGRGRGLYELIRNTVSQADVITRLRAFGSDKNLQPNYRNYTKRLSLPEPRYIDSPQGILAFGIREGQRTFEEIKPERIGSITSVVGLNQFADSTMDFDLSATSGGDTLYILDGVNPKIKFNTGNLAGYEFQLNEVGGYVHATKTFTLIPFTDERGLVFPNPDEPAFQMQVGDEYVILDITPPETYTQTAEAKLLAKAQQYLEQNDAPKVQYGLRVDDMYLSSLAGGGAIVNFYGIGDYVTVKDTELNVDKASRIVSMRRSLLDTYKYELTLDDTYLVDITVDIINKIRDTDKIIKMNDLRDPNRARMGWKTTLELLAMIFDTDGYFDGGKIRPESIETMMLVVGAKSQQFILQDVIIQPNYLGNPNVVEVSAGMLIHYALREEIVTWDIQASTYTIPDNRAKYIYAKVSKTNYNEGLIIFSDDKITPDQDPNYYHFLVGVLNSVMEGVRWVSLTYGATAINGRFVKTGRIQSFDGRTFFDLDMSAIGGYIKFIDAEGNYRDLSDIGAATDEFYGLTVTEPLSSYVNGKVTAWFTGLNPAIWPVGEEEFHTGDHWYAVDEDKVYKRVSGAWVAVPGADILNSYRRQFKRLNGDGAIQLFTDAPYLPYFDGDLWMSPEGLRRSIAEKLPGEMADPNDWVEPFNFDNTATAIDGGIVTSGTIQLAGDKSAVWAGMSGEGTDPTSVRFWAGASYINRNTAPTRILQNGNIIGRTRIEVEGVDSTSPTGYRGQAGMSGSEVEDLYGIRFYAGSDWTNRNTADFRVNGDGFAWMRRVQLGNIRIEGTDLYGSITNYGTPPNNPSAPAQFLGDASIIFRDDVKGKFVGMGTNVQPVSEAPLTTILSRLEISETKIVPESDPPQREGENVALYLDATGAKVNYCIKSDRGKALFREFLYNGDSYLDLTITPGQNWYVDPTLYNFIIVRVNQPGGFLTLVKEEGPAGSTYANMLAPGCEVTILPINNQHGIRLWHTLRPIATSNLLINGGEMTTVKYYDGAWYVKSKFDSDY